MSRGRNLLLAGIKARAFELKPKLIPVLKCDAKNGTKRGHTEEEETMLRKNEKKKPDTHFPFHLLTSPATSTNTALRLCRRRQ